MRDSGEQEEESDDNSNNDDEDSDFAETPPASKTATPKTIPCGVCPFRSTLRAEVVRHLRVEHGVVATGKDNNYNDEDDCNEDEDEDAEHEGELASKILRCAQCSYEGLRQRDLDRHMLNVHGPGKRSIIKTEEVDLVDDEIPIQTSKTASAVGNPEDIGTAPGSNMLKVKSFAAECMIVNANRDKENNYTKPVPGRLVINPSVSKDQKVIGSTTVVQRTNEGYNRSDVVSKPLREMLHVAPLVPVKHSSNSQSSSSSSSSTTQSLLLGSDKTSGQASNRAGSTNTSTALPRATPTPNASSPSSIVFKTPATRRTPDWSLIQKPPGTGYSSTFTSVPRSFGTSSGAGTPSTSKTTPQHTSNLISSAGPRRIEGSRPSTSTSTSFSSASNSKPPIKSLFSFTCSACAEVFGSAFDLMVHVKDVHATGGGRFIRVACDRVHIGALF